MSHSPSPDEFSAEERAADSKVDAFAAILLVAIAVTSAILWISGQ